MNNNLKNTRSRKLVLDLLKKIKKPITAQEIVTALDKEINQATIYRILNIFEEKKIIFNDIFTGTKYYYIAKKKHHHIICQLCEKIKCLPCSHKISNVKGFRNIKHNMYLIGICNNCT